MLTNSSNILKDKTDKELISLVKCGRDGDAFNEICRRYENVFYKVCQKYVTPLTMSGVNVQDIFDEKYYIIYHCVNTFNSKKKTKLSTWIGNYARYLCLNSISARKFLLPTLDEDVKKHIEQIQANQTNANAFNVEDYNYILNIISQLKDKRIGEIFKYRYFPDNPNKKMIWAKIAKKLKISTQTAINLHNKGIVILRKKVKSKNISDIV